MAIDLSRERGEFIERCPECSYCIFEEILSPYFRRSFILDSKVPGDENHMHRELIEQLCDKNRDDICDMKYAAMRAAMNERQASQFGAVKCLIEDLIEQEKEIFDYDKGLKKWLEEKYLGRVFLESYAKRFDEVWKLGIRETFNGTRQTLKPKNIYEIVTSDGEDYEIHILLLAKQKQKHSKKCKLEYIAA